MQRSGFVAIVGRPNVGKSSLLNAILGKKISITSYRPQTTRHTIMGIKTRNNTQTVYVDTPGMHLGAKKALNRHMNKVAHQSLIDVNVVVFVVEALKWTDEDEAVCQLLQKVTCPIILVLNKVDLLEEKQKLLAFMQKVSQKISAEIMPISVKRDIQVVELENLIQQHLPAGVFYFPEDQVTNVDERFQAAEIVREKLMRFLEKEIPYATSVQLESFEHKDNILHIGALIYVEREGQKRIIIGDKGTKLKEMGTHARLDLEKYFEKKVFLKLWVKVKEWSNDVNALQSLGYTF